VLSISVMKVLERGTVEKEAVMMSLLEEKGLVEGVVGVCVGFLWLGACFGYA
jgi:uncharacterized membrane protein (DUF441 family)